MKSGNVKLLLGIILLLIGGLAVPAALLVPAFDAPSEEVVFESPGGATLEIETPGRFYLWHEYQTVHDGRRVVRDEHLPDGMSFDATRLDDGSPLPVKPRDNIHTGIADAASRSVGYVDVENPGTVRIEVRGGDGQMRVMSFSRSRFMILARDIGFSLLSLAVLGTGGIVLGTSEQLCTGATAPLREAPAWLGRAWFGYSK